MANKDSLTIKSAHTWLRLRQLEEEFWELYIPDPRYCNQLLQAACVSIEIDCCCSAQCRDLPGTLALLTHDALAGPISHCSVIITVTLGETETSTSTCSLDKL